MNKKLFGKRLKELRKHKNLTQEKLAEIIGSDEKQVSSWERGIYFPEYTRLLNICKALNIELSNLFDFRGFKDILQLKEECHKLIDGANDDEIKTIYKIISSILIG